MRSRLRRAAISRGVEPARYSAKMRRTIAASASTISSSPGAPGTGRYP
ncbi:hypothetical protein [Terrihabitans soli]